MRDRLQDVLGLDSNSCEFMLSGKPKAAAGEMFVAVHPGAWQPHPESGDDDLDESLGVLVTVSRKLGFAPADRQGIAIWAAVDKGLEVVLRRIVAAVHKSYVVLATANVEYLGLGWPHPAGGIVEPLLFKDGGKPDPKGPEWFGADTPKDQPRVDAGLAQTLTFGGARKLAGPASEGDLT